MDVRFQEWWEEEDPDEMASGMLEHFSNVDDDTRDRQDWIVRNFCIYGDRAIFDSVGYMEAMMPRSRRMMTRNVIAGAADAVLSGIIQTRPRPMFLSIGGDWQDRERARTLTQYSDGLFSIRDLRNKMVAATRDSIIAGFGVIRPYACPVTGKILFERIFPSHFIVDDRGLISAAPRNYFIRHSIPRYHLKRLYPESAEAIEDAELMESHGPLDMVAPRYNDIVEVIECVHLPSHANDKGVHLQAVRSGSKGALLWSEDYEYPDPPFAIVQMVPPSRGFYADSLVSRAAPIQGEINKLSIRIQESMHIHARAILLVPRNSGINTNLITNSLASIIEYNGSKPPTQFTPSSMPSDVYAYMRDLEQKVYMIMGVSELSAASLKPRGLDSGRALQVYNDVQSRRFIFGERSFEQLHIEVAKIVCRINRRLAQDDPEHRVVYQSELTRRTEEIRWDELDLDEERYRIQVFPTSALPQDPAAKIQTLAAMREDGLISTKDFYILGIDIPDLESERDRVVAPIENIRRVLALMLKTGEYQTPEPTMDLATAVEEAKLAIQRAYIDEVPDDRINLLRDFMADAGQQHMDAMQAAMPPAPLGPPGGAPMPMPGAPMPPPPGMEEPMPPMGPEPPGVAA